jgi:hypothetical protein
MRTALICYHKNVFTNYDRNWINQYKLSVLNQTCQDFDIYELNYGGGSSRIFGTSKNFISYPFPSFVHGMNYLLTGLFFPANERYAYDAVFNTNVDDYYDHSRVEKQMQSLRDGYDIVSSNFVIISPDGTETTRTQYDHMSTQGEILRDHNIIGHPGVAYSRKFWKANRYDPMEVPYEDLRLWQRTVHDFRFKILPDYLFYYRQHPNSVCQNPNNR